MTCVSDPPQLNWLQTRRSSIMFAMIIPYLTGNNNCFILRLDEVDSSVLSARSDSSGETVNNVYNTNSMEFFLLRIENRSNTTQSILLLRRHIKVVNPTWYLNFLETSFPTRLFVSRQETTLNELNLIVLRYISQPRITQF